MTEARCAGGVAFLRALGHHGERPALTDGHQSLSYRDLAARMAEVALDLGPVRRLVQVAAVNRIDLLVHYLGALAAGHVVLLTSGHDGSAGTSADALTRRYDPDVVIRPAGSGVQVDERRPGTAHLLHPDLALLLSTSGSTGSPKLVRLSGDAVDANAGAIAEYLEIGPEDRAITSLPVSYCYGLSVVHSALVRGATVVVTGLSVVDACFWDVARDAGVTMLAGVPYTFDLLDRCGGPTALTALASLRTVTQAGGRLDPDAVRRWAGSGRRAGWSFVVMYGQTEATARMAYLPPTLAEEYPSAIGIAVPGGSLRIDHRAEHEAGVGEIVYSGPNVMLGYAESPADLALGRRVDELRTGDLGRVDDTGLFEVVGRCARRAKLFGLRIDLAHVEAEVRRAERTPCMVTASDQALGILVEGLDPRAAEGVRRRVALLAGLPERAVVVRTASTLPRRANGKPDLSAAADLLFTPDLRDEAPEHEAVATPSTARVPGATRLAALLDLYGDALSRPDASADSTFVGLGGDSLSYVEVSVRLEEVLGRLPAAWPRMTLRELAAIPQRRGFPGIRRVETSVLLRAVAIVLVVGSHANVFDAIGKLEGGAHVLVALVGYNVARFHLGPAERRARVRGLLRSTARVAVPSVLFITALVLSMNEHGPANILLLNSLLGPDEVGPPWEFWFIEVVVQTLLVVTAVLSIPAVDRWQRRYPFTFPVVLIGLGLLPRLGLVELPEGPSQVQTAEAVFWLFGLGWAAAAATRVWQRALISTIGLVALAGFFENPRREFLVLVGLLLLIWIRDVPVVGGVQRVAGVLAGASLTIYLTHWQVFPHLQDEHPVPALLASLAVGVAVDRTVSLLSRRLLLAPVLRRWTARPQPVPAPRSSDRAPDSSALPSSSPPVTRAATSSPSTSAQSARAETGSVNSANSPTSPSSQILAAGAS